MAVPKRQRHKSTSVKIFRLRYRRSTESAFNLLTLLTTLPARRLALRQRVLVLERRWFSLKALLGRQRVVCLVRRGFWVFRYVSLLHQREWRLIRNRRWGVRLRKVKPLRAVILSRELPIWVGLVDGDEPTVPTSPVEPQNPGALLEPDTRELLREVGEEVWEHARTVGRQGAARIHAYQQYRKGWRGL